MDMPELEKKVPLGIRIVYLFVFMCVAWAFIIIRIDKSKGSNNNCVSKPNCLFEPNSPKVIPVGERD